MSPSAQLGWPGPAWPSVLPVLPVAAVWKKGIQPVLRRGQPSRGPPAPAGPSKTDTKDPYISSFNQILVEIYDSVAIILGEYH